MNKSLIVQNPAGALTSERIDPQRLRANFEKFKTNEKSSNTRKTYASQWHAFELWCKSNGLPALPAEAVTLAAYIEHLYNAGKQRSTIDIARAAIKWHHLDAGHTNPFNDADLGKMYVGMVRTLADEGRTTPRVKPTINLEDLRAMSRACGDTLIGLRDRALILVAYAGWMRRAEPLKLRVEAMEWHADYVRCWLGATMTDATALIIMIVLGTVAALAAGYVRGLLRMSDDDIQKEQDKHAPEQARMRDIKKKMSRRSGR